MAPIAATSVANRSHTASFTSTALGESDTKVGVKTARKACVLVLLPAGLKEARQVGPKPIKEDPVRLRECLEALSDACGHNVFRVQVTAVGKDVTLVVTCSRRVQEDVIAKLLASELVRATGVTEWAEPEVKP